MLENSVDINVLQWASNIEYVFEKKNMYMIHVNLSERSVNC